MNKHFPEEILIANRYTNKILTLLIIREMKGKIPNEIMLETYQNSY